MASVLVVDDEASIANLLEDVLDHEGYDVRWAANGAVALAMARAERPDIIITDVMMPVLRGTELVQAMEAYDQLRTVPVILMSAAPKPDIPDRECDHLQFIRKPFRLAKMIELVRLYI